MFKDIQVFIDSKGAEDPALAAAISLAAGHLTVKALGPCRSTRNISSAR
ncbi:hypothetical protein [Hankyongella ginsenosidimutans]|nr:hypothetical protein [Hankyongella ginsenosidimutans]